MQNEAIAGFAIVTAWGLLWEFKLRHTETAKRFKAYADTQRGVRGVLFGLLMYLYLGVAMLALLFIARLTGCAR